MSSRETRDGQSASPASNERGYTFVEVLIVVAVIAALSIGAFALFTGRGKSTEMTALAQEVGHTIQSQQHLMYRNLRNGKVSAAEIAGSLNSLLADHRFVNSVADGQAACTSPSATKSGLILDLDTDEFNSNEEAGELQSIIHASIVNVFSDEDGIPYTDERSFHDVLLISAPGALNEASAYLGDSAAASYVVTPPSATVNVCLDNT